MSRIAWMLLFAAGAALAGERPRDFAYQIGIEADARDALYEVTLPPAVYRGVARRDLGDLRVFNAQGEVVPHALRPRAADDLVRPAAVDLPFFPVLAAAGGAIEGMNVRVQRRADGTIVSVQSREQAQPAQRRLRGYMIDATRHDQPLRALEFGWKRIAEGYSGRIRIEGSDDLARWHELARDAALVSLEFGGHRLEQRRVELGGQKYRYLRVSWNDVQPALELTAVRAEHVANVAEPARMWLAYPASAAVRKPGEHEFDLGGFFSFDRMRIELPQENSVARVELLARERASDEWRKVADAVVYRLRRDGDEVKNPDLAVRGHGERHWLLRIDQKGGGLGAGVPALHVGAIPQRLVFAARGPGPFRLAYGNRDAKAAAFPIATLIPGYGTPGELKPGAAALGEQAVLGGEERLRERPDYRKWALWASLVLGVAVLGGMAYRLARQMSKSRVDASARDRAAGG